MRGKGKKGKKKEKKGKKKEKKRKKKEKKRKKKEKKRKWRAEGAPKARPYGLLIGNDYLVVLVIILL